jgi:replicative DNA helicase
MSEHQMRGISTGFHEIDRMTKGLCAGNLLVLAGRPSMRKIVLAMNIAEHVAFTEHLPVGIFLIENDAGEAVSCSIPKTGSKDQVYLSVAASNAKHSDAECLIDFDKHSFVHTLHLQKLPALSLDELRSKLQLLSQQCGQLGLIVLDSLQQISTATQLGKAGNNANLYNLANDLKLMAKEFQCPILVLSDLSEKVETRTHKRPTMKDLRIWGKIDHVADLVFFIYRDDVYNNNSMLPGITEITLIKNINGYAGRLLFGFQEIPTRRFVTLHSEAHDY